MFDFLKKKQPLAYIDSDGQLDSTDLVDYLAARLRPFCVDDNSSQLIARSVTDMAIVLMGIAATRPADYAPSFMVAQHNTTTAIMSGQELSIPLIAEVMATSSAMLIFSILTCQSAISRQSRLDLN